MLPSLTSPCGEPFKHTDITINVESAHIKLGNHPLEGFENLAWLPFPTGRHLLLLLQVQTDPCMGTRRSCFDLLMNYGRLVIEYPEVSRSPKHHEVQCDGKK